jgi:mxaD protein
MKKIVLLISSLLFAFTIFAHGPTPQKVQKSVKIAASPDKVWEVVKDFDNANKWLPFVSDIKVEVKGEDKFRTLTLKEGGKVLERLKGIDDDLMKIKKVMCQLLIVICILLLQKEEMTMSLRFSGLQDSTGFIN